MLRVLSYQGILFLQSTCRILCLAMLVIFSVRVGASLLVITLTRMAIISLAYALTVKVLMCQKLLRTMAEAVINMQQGLRLGHWRNCNGSTFNGKQHWMFFCVRIIRDCIPT